MQKDVVMFMVGITYLLTARCLGSLIYTVDVFFGKEIVESIKMLHMEVTWPVYKSYLLEGHDTGRPTPPCHRNFLQYTSICLEWLSIERTGQYPPTVMYFLEKVNTFWLVFPLSTQRIMQRVSALTIFIS